MGTGGTLNGERPILQFINHGSRVAGRTPLNIFEVTPLSYTSRHFMIAVLVYESVAKCTNSRSPLTFALILPWLSVFCMIAL